MVGRHSIGARHHGTVYCAYRVRPYFIVGEIRQGVICCNERAARDATIKQAVTSPFLDLDGATPRNQPRESKRARVL